MYELYISLFYLMFYTCVRLLHCIIQPVGGKLSYVLTYKE